MSEIATTRPDRDFPPGPWDDEPDKLQWRDPATGLPCLIVRNPLGGLCGYVGLYPGHPWYGKGYSECTLPEPCSEAYCSHGPDDLVSVHGGLTYGSEPCQPDDGEGHGICHVPEPGEAVPMWLGFDCVHSGDAYPGHGGSAFSFLPLLDGGPGRGDVYRDIAFVRAEVTSLAGQLAAVARG